MGRTARPRVSYSLYWSCCAHDGVTIVTVTHDMGLVCEHADRVLLLSGGTGTFDGAPSQLFFGEISQESARGSTARAALLR